jgi:hypothetical protein
MSWEFIRREAEKETWWRLDEKNNALDYLEMAVRFLMEVERTPWAWKWVCIALHGALYGFGVCALQGTNYESVLQSNKLFSWDKIPGDDNQKLIEFLIKEFGVCWTKNAEIEKNDTGIVVKVFTKENSLLLELNDKRTEVLLKIDNVRKRSLKAKMRYSTNELEICKKGNDKLLSFDEVIDKCKDKNSIVQGVILKPLVLNKEQKRAIKFMKNELRNPLEHFIPRLWSLEIHGLPEMVVSYFEIIEFLAGEAGNLRWREDEIARIKALCSAGRELALSTKIHWEISETII